MLYALVIHFCTETLCGSRQINEASTYAACQEMARTYHRAVPGDYVLECTTEPPKEQK